MLDTVHNIYEGTPVSVNVLFEFSFFVHGEFRLSSKAYVTVEKNVIVCISYWV